MDYKGVIIEENLDNKSLLEGIEVISTKVERVTESHQTPWLKQWTLDTVKIDESKAGLVATQLSHALEKVHAWYADFKNKQFHYIIFNRKVFKIKRSVPHTYEKVRKYGVSLGIPEHQLDFSPDIE